MLLNEKLFFWEKLFDSTGVSSSNRSVKPSSSFSFFFWEMLTQAFLEFFVGSILKPSQDLQIIFLEFLGESSARNSSIVLKIFTYLEDCLILFDKIKIFIQPFHKWVTKFRENLFCSLSEIWFTCFWIFWLGWAFPK